MTGTPLSPTLALSTIDPTHHLWVGSYQPTFSFLSSKTPAKNYLSLFMELITVKPPYITNEC
jgi:hypothetical protein